MFSTCSGYAPKFQKLDRAEKAQTPHYPAPLYPSFPYMPDTVMPGMPTGPMTPTPIQRPGTMPSSPGTMPSSPGATPSAPSLTPPTQVNPTVPMVPSNNPQMPDVLPESPLFTVPSNPLLPPGYQEILSYNNLQYMNGFLRTQIGRTCDVEFLIGSDSIQTRSGILIAVGINYILLQDVTNNDILTCDYYSIKFVRFHY